MKGLSVVVAIALLVLAHHLATRMKRAGVLPTETQRSATSYGSNQPGITQTSFVSIGTTSYRN